MRDDTQDTTFCLEEFLWFSMRQLASKIQHHLGQGARIAWLSKTKIVALHWSSHQGGNGA